MNLFMYINTIVSDTFDTDYGDMDQTWSGSIAGDCYHGDGRYYVGKVNVTKDGIPCQPWASQEPQPHQRQPSIYPTLAGAENYCRNAEGEEDRPWCYTQNKSVRWQHCTTKERQLP